VTTDSSEQIELRDRVVRQYLPAWCASDYRLELMEPALFVTPDWRFLTPGLAHWFLTAIDEGVVEVSDGHFGRGDSWSEGIFEQAGSKGVSPRPPKLRRESFFEIAAVGMLAVRYGWPVEASPSSLKGGRWTSSPMPTTRSPRLRSPARRSGCSGMLSGCRQVSRSAGSEAITMKVSAPRARTITGNTRGFSSSDRGSSGSSDLERSSLTPISSFVWKKAAAASSVYVA
jgi:hypothetical protein